MDIKINKLTLTYLISLLNIITACVDFYNRNYIIGACYLIIGISLRRMYYKMKNKEEK